MSCLYYPTTKPVTFIHLSYITAKQCFVQYACQSLTAKLNNSKWQSVNFWYRFLQQCECSAYSHQTVTEIPQKFSYIFPNMFFMPYDGQ